MFSTTRTQLNDERKIKLAIVDPELYRNKEFMLSLENFNATIQALFSIESIVEHDLSEDVLYISSHFEGPVFEHLLSKKKPIISDLIVQHCIKERIVLPFPKFPLYNYQMKNFVICFSTTDKRQTIMINRYLNLIRFMAGQSRRDMKTGRSFDRTHLIETTTESDNYKLAVIYGIPILKKEWIDVVWKQRRNVNFCATNNAEVEAPHRLKPFTRLQISLYNYTSEEEAELRQAVLKNGGKVLPVGETIAEGCTHLVVKIVQQDLQQAEVSSLIEGSAHLPKYVVTDKWLTLCLETLTREDESGCRLKVPGLLNFSATMGGHHFNYNSCTPSKGDDSIAHHTMSSLLLSPNYDKSFDEVNTTVDKADLKKQAITQELYQTEMNYVTILKDVLKIFHEPLKNPLTPGELPNEIELKTMFGGLPPIIEVHEQILRELEPVVANWKAENEVGKIFQKHSKTFLTVYPQYINFFEQTKEMIETCKLKYPCFSKFIRASQLNAECKKQTFQELLINPIQRLPRIEMYLRVLLSKTDNLHPDYRLLNEALSTIVSVNSEINQEKKKTEGRMEMFDILNDIEDAPADILSANRHLICICDARLLVQSEGTVKMIHKLEQVFSLLLFTDKIVLCKKRSGPIKRTNSKRDKAASVLKKARKSYKHIETVDFSMLREIYTEFDDNEQIPDVENAFVMVSHPSDCSSHFSMYPFVVTKNSEMNKQKFVAEILKAYDALKDQDTDSELIAGQGCVASLDFKNARSIARNLNRSKYVFMKTKDRINRTFSSRRSMAHLRSSVSLDNLNASFTRWPFSPSKRPT